MVVLVVLAVLAIRHSCCGYPVGGAGWKVDVGKGWTVLNVEGGGATAVSDEKMIPDCLRSLFLLIAIIIMMDAKATMNTISRETMSTGTTIAKTGVSATVNKL